MSSFTEALDRLKGLVGEGMLQGTVEFNQVYARYQDGTGDPDMGYGTAGVVTPTAESHGPAGKPGRLFDHPNGGKAGYLSGTLTEMGEEVAQSWADAIGNEKPMVAAMTQNVQDLALRSAALAPVEIAMLRLSAASQVIDNGHVAFDQPAMMPRVESQFGIDELHGGYRILWSTGDTVHFERKP